ncbi:MAG: hypothetical protein KF893_05565 [Caldilineaceae bacterium]|nr:hypothetical protein [Caldilineaceae bacterium]
MQTKITRSSLHALVLGLFTILTLILSWPLALRIFGWVPGVAQWAFDESTFLWNIWYFKHAAIDNLSSPLHSDLIYYPLGIDLILYTYNFFNALIAQPLHVAVGLVFASNITILLSTILSGYGTFLLVRYLLQRDWGLGIGDRRLGVHRLDAPQSGTIHPSPAIRNPQFAMLAALAAGILYAFASNRAIYAALGHYDMVTTQWIPFYALTLLRSLDGDLSPSHRRRAALLAGIFFAFNGLAEMITALFLAIFTVIVVLVKLGTEDWGLGTGDRGSGSAPRITHYALRILAPALLIIGAISFTLWSPVLVPILVQFFTDDYSLRGWGEAIPLSVDLLGWFTPTVLHPIFGGELIPTLRQVLTNWTLPGDLATGFRDINTVFLGWTAMLLALLGAWIYRRRISIWGWTVLTFGLFTLGPFLQINGRYRFDLDGVETSFPLPFALLHYIPIIKANRAPNRNSVLLMLGLAVLAGFAIYWILGKIKNNELRMGKVLSRQVATPILYSLLITLLLFEHLALPLPLSDARVPAVYEIIAADPAPVSVMHAPLGWRNSFGVLGAERTLLQYYQVVHQKPMLGGNISRAPDFKMDYFARIPFFQAIIEVENGREPSPELGEAAAAQAEELLYLYNVGYVLLTPPIEQRFPYVDTWQATWDFFKATLPLEPQPFWTGDGIEAYRVVQSPGEDRFELALGEPGTFPYRAEGWDAAEIDAPYGLPAVWATDAESCLLIPLRQIDAAKQYRLDAQIRPFDYPGSAAQTVTAWINGERLATQNLINDWQTVSWDAPAALLHNTVNRLCLGWNYAISPRQALGGDRSIGATGATLPADVELKSFADGAWISVFEEATGQPVNASAGRRGVNVTVIHPQRGDVVEMQGFDTAANEFESARLAEFLAQIPGGYPVLVASRGDAWNFLTEAAMAELRTIGADLTLDAVRERYFSVIGVKNAAPGAAIQSVDGAEAFLRLGLNPDRRNLAAAVGNVVIGD